ncbi:MAG: hypothetical protein IPP88_10620 [Betaproteobacteria bacterium]|nr:hypothetical protein [Betaproteobacteria bacterium]
MDTDMVFVKTVKGHEEIEMRVHHLNFKHRTALIVVDGRSPVDALLGKIPGDGLILLDELLRDGFIAPVQERVPSRLPEPSPAMTSVPAAGFDLKTAKHQAVLIIEGVLGPGGESLAIAIEHCKSHAEFAQHAQRARDIISQVSGQRKAAEFWAKTGL